MKHVLWYLLAGTRGGEMRARILYTLKKKPCNANQLAKQLNVDYKTIQHHINILHAENIVQSHGKYAATHFIREELEQNWREFEEIWKKIRHK